MSAASKVLQFKYAPPIFICLILLVGHFSFGILESFSAILISIGTSIFTELILSRLMYGQWKKNVSSAYITGISISMLIRSTFLWPFALGGRSLHYVEVCAEVPGQTYLESFQLRFVLALLFCPL